VSARTAPSRSVDGRHRLTIRVNHRLTRAELVSAVMICAEMSADPAAYTERPVAEVRADVVHLLRCDGASMGALDGMGVEGDMAEALARAEAIVAKAYPTFPLDPPPEPRPGRALTLRPRGRGNVDLVDDDGETFEWPPPDPDDASSANVD
jgi:hypothetical protein